MLSKDTWKGADHYYRNIKRIFILWFCIFQHQIHMPHTLSDNGLRWKKEKGMPWLESLIFRVFLWFSLGFLKIKGLLPLRHACLLISQVSENLQAWAGLFFSATNDKCIWNRTEQGKSGGHFNLPPYCEAQYGVLIPVSLNSYFFSLTGLRGNCFQLPTSYLFFSPSEWQQ